MDPGIKETQDSSENLKTQNGKATNDGFSNREEEMEREEMVREEKELKRRKMKEEMDDKEQKRTQIEEENEEPPRALDQHKIKNRGEDMDIGRQLEKAKSKGEKRQRDLEEKKVKQKNIYFILAFLLGLFASFILWHLLTKGQEETQQELRLMLVGKTGAGKSAAGNTILGGEFFRAGSGPEVLTYSCNSTTKVIEGTRVTVIDTPGVSDAWLTSVPTDMNPYDCISSIAHSPHVFLLVVSLGRYAEEMHNVKWIEKKFGEAAVKFTIVLFTDLLGGKPVEKFISQSTELAKLVEMCEGGYHVFNNEMENRNQVTELFEKINKILNKHVGYKFIKEVCEKVVQDTREDVERKREEMEIEKNIEMQKKLNNMAINLRDEHYENSKLMKKLEEAERWFALAVVSIIVLLVILGCVLKKLLK